jgi:hypothetical protein
MVVVHKDQDWANQVWVPVLAASGVKRFALVTAGSGLGKATVEDVIERADSRGLLMRHFRFDSGSAYLAGRDQRGPHLEHCGEPLTLRIPNPYSEVGGDAQNRTGDGGFADLCLATWLRRLAGSGF